MWGTKQEVLARGLQHITDLKDTAAFSHKRKTEAAEDTQVSGRKKRVSVKQQGAKLLHLSIYL